MRPRRARNALEIPHSRWIFLGAKMGLLFSLLIHAEESGHAAGARIWTSNNDRLRMGHALALSLMPVETVLNTFFAPNHAAANCATRHLPAAEIAENPGLKCDPD